MTRGPSRSRIGKYDCAEKPDKLDLGKEMTFYNCWQQTAAMHKIDDGLFASPPNDVV